MKQAQQHKIKIAGQEWDDRYYYNPNSMIHGTAKGAFGGPGVKQETLLRLELDRMRDFIEFLFEHSEHCDHITFSEAWQEFEIHEAKTSMIADKKREYRKKLKE